MVYGSGKYDADESGRTGTRGRFQRVKLVVCLWVVFIACFMRLAFPEKIDAARDNIMLLLRGNADFDSAIAVFGEAAAGERSVLDALNEACYYAFTIVPNSVEVIDDADIGDNAISGDAEQSDTASGVETSVTENADIDAAGDAENADIATGAADGDGSDAGTETAVADAVTDNNELSEDDGCAPDNVTFKRVELTAECTAPAEGVITSRFGYRDDPNGGGMRFHYGVDIGAAKGSEVYAFADGVVLSVADSASYGLYMTIEHDGMRTLYAHLDSVLADAGDPVTVGDVIALSGDSGNATGACLHFELTVGGVYVDPEFYIAL